MNESAVCWKIQPFPRQGWLWNVTASLIGVVFAAVGFVVCDSELPLVQSCRPHVTAHTIPLCSLDFFYIIIPDQGFSSFTLHTVCFSRVIFLTPSDEELQPNIYPQCCLVFHHHSGCESLCVCPCSEGGWIDSVVFGWLSRVKSVWNFSWKSSK